MILDMFNALPELRPFTDELDFELALLMDK